MRIVAMTAGRPRAPDICGMAERVERADRGLAHRRVVVRQQRQQRVERRRDRRCAQRRGRGHRFGRWRRRASRPAAGVARRSPSRPSAAIAASRTSPSSARSCSISRSTTPALLPDDRFDHGRDVPRLRRAGAPARAPRAGPRSQPSTVTSDGRSRRRGRPRASSTRCDPAGRTADWNSARRSARRRRSCCS